MSEMEHRRKQEAVQVFQNVSLHPIQNEIIDNKKQSLSV